MYRIHVRKFAWLVAICFSTFHGVGQSFNFYRGNLHAHTAYSDGNKDSSIFFINTPTESYDYAKNSMQFDFLGISEHNHSGAGMSLPRYAQGIAEAAFATQTDFVALYGMEWGTISGGGHVVIYGLDSLMGWEAGNYSILTPFGDYTNLFSMIKNRPSSFAYLAHPDVTDYNALFSSSYNSVSDQAIVGVAIESGPAFSTDTNYTNPSTPAYYQRYKDVLAKGYHVGPTIDHDNHYSTFGRTTPGRLVILAPSLSKANIMEAMKSNRFYASEDWNTEVNFTLNSSYYMGQDVSDVSNPSFQISIVDPDLNDTTDYIRLRYAIQSGGNTAPTILASSNVDNVNTLTYTHSISSPTAFYYFLEIRQKDGDMIYTAPIWYEKNALLPIELLSFEATKNELSNTIDLHWATASEQNTDYFLTERSTDGEIWSELDKMKAAGNSTDMLNYSQNDPNPEIGLNYYRLTEFDLDGTSKDFRITSEMIDPSNLFEIYPNPADNEIYIDQYGEINFDSFVIVSQNGIKIMEEKFEKSLTIINVDEWISGRYFIQFLKNNAVVTSATFIVD